VATLHDAFANGVRAERGRRRWTQAQLAERLGWPRNSIHEVELGRRRLTLDDIADVCRAFGMPLVELCRGGDDDAIRALGIDRRG